MFMQLYKALIRPHIEYATVVWNPYLKKKIFLIENVQGRTTKLVSGICHLSYAERLRNLGLPMLNYRRCRTDMKILNKIDSIPLDKFFTIADGTRTLGHKHKLVKGNNRTRHRACMFSQRVINPWKHLPSSCVESDSVNSFKSPGRIIHSSLFVHNLPYFSTLPKF